MSSPFSWTGARRALGAALTLGLATSGSVAAAQTIPTTLTATPGSNQPSATAPVMQAAGAPTPTTGQTLPKGPQAFTNAEASDTRPPPLGAELFNGATPSSGVQINDPTYVMKPGDQVHVTLFGLQTLDGLLTIDTRGNIVIPGVGPVQVGGTTAGGVQSVVANALHSVFSSGVEVYASAVQAAPLQLFVTGPVAKPGSYSAGYDDSIVTLLQRAGGIDRNRGSYRHIAVVRHGQVLVTADLYQFLRDGVLPRVAFQNGDAIVVGPQGQVVSVEGDVRAPFTFELANPGSRGAELMDLARPQSDATHVGLSGVRNSVPYSIYDTLAAFANEPIADGDRVRFERDVQAGTITVRVEGLHAGPSVFTVPRGSSLGGLVSQITFDRLADTHSIYLRRVSVQATQTSLLDASLDRLERDALTAPMRSADEAAARQREAEFVTAFVDRAKMVQPLGIVTLAGVDLNTVILEPDDVVVIPDYSQVVTIDGEIMAPQSVIHHGDTVAEYVRSAGGFTPRADRARILVLRPDGGFRQGNVVMPGDRILVPAKISSEFIELTKDITQIIYQIAVAAKVAL